MAEKSTKRAPRKSAAASAEPLKQMDDAPSVDDILKQRRYSLWFPADKVDLLIDYPELRRVKEFIALDANPRKMLFVWYYASKSSPFREVQDPKQRIAGALKAAWPERVPKEIEGPYMEQKWGEDVSEAIATMRLKEPGPRAKMKVLFEINFERVKRMLEGGLEPLGWKDKMEYFNAVKAGTELLKNLSSGIEDGAFGIVEESLDVDDYDEGELMDQFQRELRTDR